MKKKRMTSARYLQTWKIIWRQAPLINAANTSFSVKPKLSTYCSDVDVTTVRLFRSENMDSLLTLVMQGQTIRMEIDEQIVYNQLNWKKNAIWSLLLASGYLKVEETEFFEETGRNILLFPKGKAIIPLLHLFPPVRHPIFSQCCKHFFFHIDKTAFIKEWWENEDSVTLIARPRRFGKTLNMSMVEKFFSMDYAGRGELFEGLAIWKEEGYRLLLVIPVMIARSRYGFVLNVALNKLRINSTISSQ